MLVYVDIFKNSTCIYPESLRCLIQAKRQRSREKVVSSISPFRARVKNGTIIQLDYSVKEELVWLIY